MHYSVMIEKKLKLTLYLTLSISLISLTHALFPFGIFLALPVILGIYLDIKNKSLLNAKWTTFLAITGFLAFAVFAIRFPFEAIGYLLIYLISLRVLGEKNLREYKQIFALSFFALVASSIFHYSLIFLLYVAFYILLGSFTLLIFSFLGDTTEHTLDYSIFRKLLKFVLYFDFSVIILSIPLFIILPRSPYVFFRAPSYIHSEIEGFGNEINIGEISQNFNMDRVIMRVKPLQSTFPKVLYIRGNVLDDFDGKMWKRTHIIPYKWQKLEKIQFVKHRKTSGKYEIQLTPMETKVLYVVDFPHTVLLGKLHVFKDWGRVISFPPGKISHITVYKSFNTDLYTDELDNREIFLSIPHELEGVVDSILFVMGIPEKRDIRIIRGKIENYLKNNFRYTTNVSSSKDPVKDFLKKKEGYCEHFATLAALMLRRMGIPSRLVVGFRTIERNPYGKYYVVRVKHAHAWVEYFSQGQWLRLDPTPAQVGLNYITRLAEYWDYLIYLWNTQILQFNYLAQIKIFLAFKLQLQKLREFKIPRSVYPVMVFLLLLVAVLTKFFHRFQIHPATRYLNKFEKFMKKRGYEFKIGETPLEFSQRFCNPLIQEFIEAYYRARFGGINIQELKKLYLKIKKTF